VSAQNPARKGLLLFIGRKVANAPPCLNVAQSRGVHAVTAWSSCRPAQSAAKLAALIIALENRNERR
jgi:hypothetical protein